MKSGVAITGSEKVKIAKRKKKDKWCTKFASKILFVKIFLSLLKFLLQQIQHEIEST